MADSHLATLRRRPPRRIVVDTFPGGWRGELDEALLGRFERRIRIARYAQGLESRGEAYHRVLAPYPSGCCEWAGGLEGAVHAGYFVDAGHVAVTTDAPRFTVLGPDGRCNSHLLGVFAGLARRAGLQWRYRRRLISPLPARKLLAVGVGYHTFYELLGQGADLRFLPVRKRYDDQFRRAGLFGLDLSRLDQVLPWLAAPFRPVAEDTVPRWSEALAFLLEG